MTRENYIYLRLMELADIATSRELDDVEKREEKRLEEELAAIMDKKYNKDPNYQLVLERETKDGHPCLVAQIKKREK